MRRAGTKQILGLGIIKNIKDLRDKVQRAKNKPEELTNLLCKDFNLRQSDEKGWLDFNSINNETTFEMDNIYNSYCVGGVDLSSTTDLTCATLIVKKKEKIYVMQQYFMPREKLEFKMADDKVPYDQWERRGLLKISEGSKNDYSEVTKWFLQMADDYKLSPLFIGYDPWNTQYWIEEMKDYGFNMFEVRQGAKTLSNPMKELEADLIDKKVIYNNNPILKWCLCNTAVKSDDNDNIRPVKRKTLKS